MSSFQFPTSSSPPSTPDRRNEGRVFSFGMSNPSTTPAGPPPSSAGSFTPAGLPPSSILGSPSHVPKFSSQPFPSLKFSKDSTFSPSPKPSPSAVPYVRSSKADQPSRLNNEFNAPKSQGFSANLSDEEDEMDDTEVESYNDEEQQHGDYVEKEKDSNDFYSDDDQEMDDLRFNSSGSGARSTVKSYGMSQMSNHLTIRPNTGLIDFRRSIENSKGDSSQDSVYGPLAADVCKRLGVASLHESDDLILGTEELVVRLYEEGIKATAAEDVLTETLMIIPSELLKLWADYAVATAAHISEEYAATIGPGPKASNFANANFLASLVLRMRHPGLNSSNSNAILRSSMLRGSLSSSLEGKAKQIPLILLEWMDDYHDPYPAQLDEVQGHRPSPAHHRLFWDTILNSLLRGRVVAVVNALKTAGWKHARAAIADVRDKSAQIGYSGVALAAIEKVIGDAINVLQLCPAMRGDWDTRGSDWTLFRLRVDQSLENLKTFAEGADVGVAEPDVFGKSSIGMSYTGTARKAESQVPWEIYQNLLTMYNLVLGDSNCIIENAQDWCESVIGLLVWWNPRNDKNRAILDSSTDPDIACRIYLAKLTESFYLTTADATDFEVNTLNPVEIGLACIFEGDYEAVIVLMQAWSGPVSSATAEIGSLAGWLLASEPQSLIAMDSLYQDDMDVLGLGSQSVGTRDIKDRTLVTYANALVERRQMETRPRFGYPRMVRHGWEVAIEVLGRLNSTTQSEEEVGRMIHDVHLESRDTVDKLWTLLNDLSMTTHAENIAEEWADQLAEDSFKYGEALWYYSLAHKSKKVKDVLDLLISFSLIQSVAYPPEAEVDDHLRRLISSPKTALTELSTTDYEAGQLLHKMLSGYATLRRFYDVRDEEVNLQVGERPKLGPLARKSEAAAALMAVISSSDDNIRGGLFDESRDAVVSVDFLLALVGEAMVFVNQPKISITAAQIIILLKAVEDLQTVPTRIYAASDEFFQTVIASAQGLKGSSPMDLLRKSTSNLSGTSSFAMVGSSMFASQLQRSIGSSGIMVKGNVKRGWDWRRELSAGTTSKNVIQIVRFGLAKDMARVWLSEADEQL